MWVAPASFAFARDFVMERGYRICIDGLNLNTFPYADTNRLGVAYAKLMWTPDLAAFIGTTQGQEFKQLLQEQGP